MANNVKQTAGRDVLGNFSPAFAALNDDVLFGQVWNDEVLSLRDRSFLTITTLIAQGITDNSLVYHLKTAKANGISRAEIAAIITQIAFYAGWPKAWTAFNLAKTVWTEEENVSAAEADKAKFVAGMRFPLGEPNTAYAQYFTGESYLAMLSQGDMVVANVTFEPGCRNHWHIHHGQEQLLVCVAGDGWYQEAGKPARALSRGDVVTIPAEMKHWHGATKDSWFAHLSIQVPKAGATTEWLEPVADADYLALVRA